MKRAITSLAGLKGHLATFRCVNTACARYHDRFEARVWIERGPGGAIEYRPVETDSCLGCGKAGELVSDLAEIERDARSGWREE